jgi:hypothetical protein
MSHLSFNDLTALNALCNVYNAGLGYNNDEACLSGPNALDALKDHVDWIERVEPDQIDDGEEHDIEVEYNLDTKNAKVHAMKYYLDHDEILIRLRNDGESGWTEKPNKVKRTWFDEKDVVKTPVPWYELPKRASKKLEFVEPLSDRKYITVTDPYDEVKISKETKGSKITIDDVLFASRALCVGADRSVFSYAVLQDDGKTLKLIADIDNWST